MHTTARAIKCPLFDLLQLFQLLLLPLETLFYVSLRASGHPFLDASRLLGLSRKLLLCQNEFILAFFETLFSCHPSVLAFLLHLLLSLLLAVGSFKIGFPLAFGVDCVPFSSFLLLLVGKSTRAFGGDHAFHQHQLALTALRLPALLLNGGFNDGDDFLLEPLAHCFLVGVFRLD